MKISCSKSSLVAAVSTAMKAVSNKTSLPILGCILVEADQEIKLTATDMELGIETYVEGNIIEPGKVALEAKLFFEIIRKLNESDILIETNENHEATIRCEKSEFHISGKSGDDFSVLPEVDRSVCLSLSQLTLKDVIRQTIFSTVENESTKLMSGELFEVKEDNLRVISLDGHRISIRNIGLKETHQPVKVVVPGKTLNEINKILEGGAEDIVDLYITERHILFEFGKTKVVSRLLEGEYYKIEQMLTNDYETKVEVNKKELLDCIDRASLMIRESDKKPIVFKVENDRIYLKIRSLMGSMNEDLDVKKEGKDLLIGFNPKLLMDALRVIDDETVSIYFINPKSPCYLKDETESYRYVILPVNIHAEEV